MNGELKFPDRLSFRCDFCVFLHNSAISDFIANPRPFGTAPGIPVRAKNTVVHYRR
jgi:hypothetical protein